ncbi:probable G-protein coupled receptor 160 [Sebastes umbrosus]|uniref:probable G-protein coupled receptor 160 n=1 Tax=Sebastes umbrosus TaxID=72105 RepID=UPI00189E4015|nr:probable G-protein coupled receptor 160 [Sebastes umbrosus]
MLPDSAASPDSTVIMLGVIVLKDVLTGCHVENTDKYLILMLLKSGLDLAAFFLCCRKRFSSFISMCSVSVMLADLVMVVLLASMWFLGPERYLLSLCIVLAKASAAYEALPLPVMCLGLLDCCLEHSRLGKQNAFCKFLRNAVLTLLVLMLGVVCSFVYGRSDLMELDYGRIRTLVCEVRQSELIVYFIWGLFTAVVCAMIPFWSMIPQWVKEAERLSVAREELQNESSDLLFTSTKTKSGEENYPKETVQPFPPLWFSLTLGFSLTWMPYLSVSVACMLFGFATPAYITVNVLWLECANSLLTGVVFWANSKTRGPYSQLPENVCLWHVFWHLSKGTQQQLPIAVFNPSKGKRNTLLYL